MLENMNTGILVLRIVTGLILAGHGSKKLFGWFGGKGIASHAEFMDTIGAHPPQAWAYVNAIAELAGGLCFAAGLITPIASAALLGSMVIAIVRVHWRKGVWNSGGGFEYPLVLATVAFVIGLTGPGDLSLDAALNLWMPEPITYTLILVTMIIIVVGVIVSSSSLLRHRSN